MTKFRLQEILGWMTDAAVAVQSADGRAGGTAQLWVETPDGRLIMVTEPDGPFSPNSDDEVDVDTFAVGVYPSVEFAMDGGMYQEPLYIIPASLKALSAAIQTIRKSRPRGGDDD